jgi:predicted protein tyrosine phosphatase
MDVSGPLRLREGWGSLYQGAAADQGVQLVEARLWVVCMNAGEVDDGWVDHKAVAGLTVVAIDDAPEAVLPDEQVLAGAGADVAWLSRGSPLLGHCGAGISRASYRNLATIMRALSCSYDDALTLLRTVRPQASPNVGFEAHLRRLEPDLRA